MTRGGVNRRGRLGLIDVTGDKSLLVVFMTFFGARVRFMLRGKNTVSSAVFVFQH